MGVIVGMYSSGMANTEPKQVAVPAAQQEEVESGPIDRDQL